jgi:hypothetical protein
VLEDLHIPEVSRKVGLSAVGAAFFDLSLSKVSRDLSSVLNRLKSDGEGSKG